MELIDILHNIHLLPAAEATKITQYAEEKAFPKQHTIIEAEKTARYIYFIKSGICRIFYPKAEKEIVLDFCFPGDTILSLNSYIHQISGYENVDTIEKTTVYRIPSEKIARLYQESIEIANWGRKLAELETLKIEKRLMQQLFKTAKERYLDLLQKEPNLLHHVKLGHISSYLGVSQVTLSRIRAEIK